MPTTLQTSTRPLRLRMRPDLVAERQQYQGRTFWVVKDPLTLKYYRFHEEEFAVLKLLDGQSTLEQIRRRFERDFPPQRMSLEELTVYVGSLHRAHLAISDSPGQGEQLYQQRREAARQKIWSSIGNLLSMRFRGFDPDRLLTWLDARIGRLLSWPMTVLCLVFCLAAGGLVAIEFESFRNRLPAFSDFFAVENWFWLALTLAVTKVLHEFGHGLMCKRMGGACHEMGMMLLVMTPCLYVNVSDSWMLPSRWRRAAIGAAGMYVELILASLCTFLWWFSEPGLFNYLCLNVMFVSSVTTVLFNANPLMRYDGYYILSDLLEIPNLRSKASAVLQRKLGKILLGLREPPDPFLPQRHQWLFAIYTIAAGVYGWIVTFSILWFLDQVFKPYGLQIIGQMIALVSLYGLVVHPLWRLFQFFHVPGRIEKVNRARAMVSFAAVMMLLAAALFVPLPHYVECPFTLEPRDAASVYVSVPGTLQTIHVSSGQHVAAGQPLVTLASIDVDLTLAKLEGEREELVAKVDDLRRRQYQDPEAAMEVTEAEETLHALDEQFEKRRRDRERLQVTAPANGIVLPPARTTMPEHLDPSELTTWTGTPLEPGNLGASLDEGVLVCRVGNPRQLQAVIDVDQSDVEFIRPEQLVYLKLDSLPGDTFLGQIVQVAQLERDASDASDQRAAKPKQRRPGAHGKVLTTKYQASAPLDDQENLLFTAATGTARIRAGYLTAGQRLWRYVSQTFRFQR